MRHVIRIALLVAVAHFLPAAYAESDSGGKAAAHASQPNQENCGTPNVFKPCPPLPRHPLESYPGPR
jgi:hypothetical protein